MDMEQTIDALVEALKQFAGTLLFISHDVYFIRALANDVGRQVALIPGGGEGDDIDCS